MLHPLRQNKQTIFIYSIKASQIKRFVYYDIILGTTIYYLIRLIPYDFFVSTAGSIIGVHGIKKVEQRFRSRHSKMVLYVI